MADTNNKPNIVNKLIGQPTQPKMAIVNTMAHNGGNNMVTVFFTPKKRHNNKPANKNDIALSQAA